MNNWELIMDNWELRIENGQLGIENWGLIRFGNFNLSKLLDTLPVTFKITRTNSFF